MPITNKGQFSNLCKYNTHVGSGVEHSTQPDFTVQHKKLTSQSWVCVKKCSKSRPIPNTGNYIVKKVGNVWLDFDRPHMSECVKAQWELFRKLNKDFLRRQKVRKENERVLEQKSGITQTHTLVDGVMVNMSKFVNFDASKYKKAV